LTTYRKLIEENRPPRALIYPDLFWREMGSLESYKLLNEELCKIEENRLAPFATGKTGWVHPSAQIAGDARLRGFTVIGRGCRVMRDVQMENTILWDNVVVEQGSTLLNCIVTDGLTVQGMHENETLFEVSR
jgi:NDP-sugar pyrophosphorylase family protein